MNEAWCIGDRYKVESDGNDREFFAFFDGRYVSRYERAEWGWAVNDTEELLLLSESDRSEYEERRKFWMVRNRRRN